MIKNLLSSTVFILTFNLISAQCGDYLVNGHFDVSSIIGWTETLNAANAPIELLSSSDFSGQQRSGDDAIIFSHAWASQTQIIDLVAIGYSTTALDAAPQIDVSEWYKGAGFSAPNFDDTYYYLAELLDASDVVVVSFELGTEAAPITCTSAWQQVSHSFMGYGSGVRKVRITHGGNDFENFLGSFGPIIDDSSVCVAIEILSCTDELENGHFDVSSSANWTETLSAANAPITSVSSSDFPGAARTGADAIIFSHAWASQTQTIDLVAAGYPAVYLDTAPQITVSEWYMGISSNTADEYYYLAELLDASDAVIAFYTFGSEASPMFASSTWQEVNNIFVAYGSGVRKVRITHGGNDAENFLGNFGPIVDDSSVCVADIISLSVDENTLLSNNISVYPNPSNGSVTVSLKNNNFDNATINIYTMSGQKIYQIKNIISQMHEFDLGVASGIYQIEIINKASRAYKKLVIK